MSSSWLLHATETVGLWWAVGRTTGTVRPLSLLYACQCACVSHDLGL